MIRLRAFLLWFMMLAVPFQGYAAAAMVLCSPAASQASTEAVHDHTRHDHASYHGTEHRPVIAAIDDHHGPQGAHDDSSNAFHKCGNCAACHSIGMTPTVEVSLLNGLPHADLAEPLRAMATITPRVPHKPPRA